MIIPPSRDTAFVGTVLDNWELYSDNADDYTLQDGPPIGHGASSIVYAAFYHPPSSDPSQRRPSIPCAIKVLDLDTVSLRLLQRETTLMSLSKHPNVLRVRGSWMDGHKLYIAMRLMNKGSAADVMRCRWQGGMEEEVIKCILKQALEGLNYLHTNGFLHRDVKAANLLIDDDGTVLLGDLGVAASLDDASDAYSPRRKLKLNNPSPERPNMGKRRSFVGTPCWMSPELIAGHHYDAASDIWSFGITTLELAQGVPPRSREKSTAVLLQVVRDPPPELDRTGGVHKYSRAFKEIVESCLVKDPSKRPTAAQLLQTPFFKSARKKSHLVTAILQDLPPLAERLEHRQSERHASTHLHSIFESWDFSLSHSSALSVLPASPEALAVGAAGTAGAGGAGGAGGVPAHRIGTSISRPGGPEIDVEESKWSASGGPGLHSRGGGGGGGGSSPGVPDGRGRTAALDSASAPSRSSSTRVRSSPTPAAVGPGSREGALGPSGAPLGVSSSPLSSSPSSLGSVVSAPVALWQKLTRTSAESGDKELDAGATADSAKKSGGRARMSSLFPRSSGR